ncbi:CPBP family intramembrane glutamic endopeptidase [Neobacillus terrae]|uniref:CPBP family intramembrane glutamic endopeptidase n=1 Tax=Neobacillus terrae TaxID=3034837 RepID=UPI00140B8202|nr:CPBP family intramembrane glutamic endopeptidase [Neobacillus terrae]NHM30655.1 CPBP family intramembrane metalloprotease [Neobacillus terrae]
MLFVYPLQDIKHTKKVKKSGNWEDKRAYFLFIITSEWFLTFLILIGAAAFSVSWTEFGLKLPNENTSKLLGVFSGFLIGVLFLLLVLFRLPFYKKRMEKQMESISFLAPANSKERNWGLVLSATAGICEEIIYRGLIIFYLQSLPFDLSLPIILVLSALIFGFGHIYQGWKGFLLTSFLGFVFARVYVMTDSLLFPIIIHIIIDARFFLMTKGKNKNPEIIHQEVEKLM